jgi:hypothetical protein
MDRGSILKMEAGWELDALIAERVMKWKRAHLDYVFWQPTAAEQNLRYCKTLVYRDGVEGYNFSFPFNPSADIAAEYEVMREMSAKNCWCYMRILSSYCSVMFILADGPIDLDLDARAGVYELPLAVCKAALLAVMEAK